MSDVIMTGPLFDGEAERALHDACQAAEERLARDAAGYVRMRTRSMNKSGRGGTGGAAASVSVRNEGGAFAARGESHSGIVWWPWLNGDSRRNFTTRFPGYHAWREALSRAERDSQRVTDEEIRVRLPEMT